MMPRMRIGLPQNAVSDGLTKSICLMCASASASTAALACRRAAGAGEPGGDPARDDVLLRLQRERTASRDGSVIFTGGRDEVVVRIEKAVGGVVIHVEPHLDPVFARIDAGEGARIGQHVGVEPHVLGGRDEGDLLCRDEARRAGADHRRMRQRLGDTNRSDRRCDHDQPAGLRHHCPAPARRGIPAPIRRRARGAAGAALGEEMPEQP